MFSFNKENIKKAKEILAKYPVGRQKKCCSSSSGFSSKTKWGVVIGRSH